MDRRPGRTVTVRTVTAGGEVLCISTVRRYQTTVGIMTVDTACMRVRCCVVKRIIMTACTVGRGYLPADDM